MSKNSEPVVKKKEDVNVNPDVQEKTVEETTDETSTEETVEETTDETSTEETVEETTDLEKVEKAAKELEDIKAMCEAVTKSNSVSIKTMRELYFKLVKDPALKIKLINMGDSAAARERVKMEAVRFLAECKK